MGIWRKREPRELGGPGGGGWLDKFSATFALMLAVWVVLSGKLDSFHLTLGVLSSGLVAWFGVDLLYKEGSELRWWPILGRMVFYFPWIMYQILVANLHVLRLAFSPRPRRVLEPHLVYFKSRLKNEYALVTLAQSITLTPGTITVRVSVDGLFTVHAIDRQSGDLAALKAMEVKVARLFGEF